MFFNIYQRRFVCGVFAITPQEVRQAWRPNCWFIWIYPASYECCINMYTYVRIPMRWCAILLIESHRVDILATEKQVQHIKLRICCDNAFTQDLWSENVDCRFSWRLSIYDSRLKDQMESVLCFKLQTLVSNTIVWSYDNIPIILLFMSPYQTFTFASILQVSSRTIRVSGTKSAHCVYSLCNWRGHWILTKHTKKMYSI